MCRRLMARTIPDDTICSLPKLFGDCVALINDKVLIEDLEDLSTRHVRHYDGRELEVEMFCRKQCAALLSNRPQLMGVGVSQTNQRSLNC